jgi:hypothetical protein
MYQNDNEIDTKTKKIITLPEGWKNELKERLPKDKKLAIYDPKISLFDFIKIKSVYNVIKNVLIFALFCLILFIFLISIV